jgi:hypothetical protein
MNSYVHRVNTNTHLHKPVSNLSCFQKSAFYAGIRIFSNLPTDLKCLINEKARYKAELKQYLNTQLFYAVDEHLLSRKELLYQ